MTDPSRHDPSHRDARGPAPSRRWAPWWLYLVILLGANYARNGLVSTDSLPVPIVVVIALAQAGLLFLLITAVWRSVHRGPS